MSYHLTILRTEKGNKVALQRNEVESAIGEINELQITSSTPTLLDIAYTTDDEVTSVLRYQDGEIWTRYPDNPKTMDMLLRLAELLNARVRGDEFETYRSATETYHHPDDKKIIGRAKADSKTIIRRTQRRQWILNLSVVTFGVLMAWLVNHFSR